MELKGPGLPNTRTDPPWTEENFNESRSYNSWSRQPQQFQDPGFAERNHNDSHRSFSSPGRFGRYDSPPDQHWSRMNGYQGNNQDHQLPSQGIFL